MADEPIINFGSERLAWEPCGPEHISLSLKWANDWQVSAPRARVIYMDCLAQEFQS